MTMFSNPVVISQGPAGAPVYLYQAWASDAIGTGFTTVFDPALDYTAFKISYSILTPVVGDFTGLWKNYKGATGAASYTYIAYALDSAGNGFTNTYDPTLDYIAIKPTTSPLTPPVASDFVGLWKNYKGAPGTDPIGNVAATSPTVNSDSAHGYSVGSWWWNTTLHIKFSCESAAVGAAVWRQIWPAVPGALSITNDMLAGSIGTDKLVESANVSDAITKKHTQASDDNFNGLSAKTAFSDADPLLIYSIADSAYRKMTLGDAKKLILFAVDTTATGQVIADSTDTKIAAGLSASATIDTLSGWDGVNKKYVCKEAGVYFILACVFFEANIAGDRRVHVRVNNSQVLEGLAGSWASGWGEVLGFSLTTLAVNDYVELWALQTSGGNLTCQWGNKLYMIRVG